MAQVPGGQPGVPEPGHGTGSPASRHRRLTRPGDRGLAWLALLGASVVALELAEGAGVVGAGALFEALRVVAVCVVLFGIAGFGPVALWLPARLRRHELLWVLPAGAVATALELGALGYAYVPFDIALGVVLAGNVALGIYAWRRERRSPVARGAVGQSSWRMLAVPLCLAALIGAIALVPMFRAGLATVIGNGSDAHLAVGSAQLLRGHHPSAVAPEEPVDQIPLHWRSKPPIYYAYGAVARLAGMEAYAVIAPLAAMLLALAALGFWLLARDLLGAGLWTAGAVMGLIGLNRIALHTTMHPYFNQIWGFFALPFAIVLARHVVRRRSRGGLALFTAFIAVLGFAYPLALPIALISAAVFYGFERRRRGLPVWRRPRLRSRRQLYWIIPLGILALAPLRGILEKSAGSVRVLTPGYTLESWGGDLLGFYPERWFFGVQDAGTALVALPLIIFGVVLALRRLPRDIGWGLGAVMIFGVGAALYFRPRDYGWYFHYKALAFVAPVIVAVAAVGLARMRSRWMTFGALAFLIAAARITAQHEVAITFDQASRDLLEVKQVDERLPPSASIRLDMQPNGRMQWVGHMLSGQPLCSQLPILGTAYPHVRISRAADYVLVARDLRKPFDATGPPVMTLDAFVLYRMRTGLPGGDRCSRKMVQTIGPAQLQ
ncbi:MAG: hypothetical protein M3401_10205 [Actinomycetota bacterium]|nr:hypothetical protein [Actinomycetota bacterium]